MSLFLPRHGKKMQTFSNSFYQAQFLRPSTKQRQLNPYRTAEDCLGPSSVGTGHPSI